MVGLHDQKSSLKWFQRIYLWFSFLWVESLDPKQLHHVSVLQREGQLQFEVDAFTDETSISQVPEVHQPDGRFSPRHVHRLHLLRDHSNEILPSWQAQLLGRGLPRRARLHHHPRHLHLLHRILWHRHFRSGEQMSPCDVFHPDDDCIRWSDWINLCCSRIEKNTCSGCCQPCRRQRRPQQVRHRPLRHRQVGRHAALPPLLRRQQLSHRIQRLQKHSHRRKLLSSGLLLFWTNWRMRSEHFPLEWRPDPEQDLRQRMPDPSQRPTSWRGRSHHDCVRLCRSPSGSYPTCVRCTIVCLRRSDLKETSTREAAELGLEKSVEQPGQPPLCHRGSRSDVLIPWRGQNDLERAGSLGLAVLTKATTIVLTFCKYLKGTILK